ncbi:tol-pal system protein YbgF [Acidovorax carolinensis]|uniref:Cell division coordinator CpoB n=2 Tax=Acidovorax carolinensis TaxID=553814 RepID=A0A240TSG9_9BURK|nr:tol-pal system protein YbgF [Acidovorax carolinensis]ART52040.1 tol-pal system protein YbgF [Acidovorax carolinensis]
MRAARFPMPAKTLLTLLLSCAFAATGHAALFEDDEARRAILELRQRVDALQQRSAEDIRKSGDDSSQLRRGLLDLQTQIEALRVEQAKLRGQNEQLLRDVGELQRRQKDIAQGVDERLRQFEPVKVTVDGLEFQADAAEKRDFEAALAVFRSGKFAEANTAFAGFVRQYPRSGYVPSARFWLGNAQYAAREYKDAIGNFRLLLSGSPGHARAPEAALSIANCQIELKETRAARKTLEDLLKAYPQSEAAVAAKERLSRLK